MSEIVGHSVGEIRTADVEFKAFGDRLNELAKVAKEMPPDVASVEAETENGLIEPFFKALRYENKWQHRRKRYGTAKWGNEKVDYALLDSSGEPLTLVECKSLATKLDRDDRRQLRRYYNDTEAKVGILTNGETYEIYLDNDKNNVMDEEPFFTFALGEMDELALRAVSRLTRLEDGSFDLQGFKEDVEAHKFTTRYKTQAVQVFQGWLDRTDEEFVKLLEKKLEAPDDSLGDLIQQWFEEFVSGKKPECENAEAQQPGLSPLPDWRIGVKKDLPRFIVFPSHTANQPESAEINHAYDVAVETTRWLIDNGHLTRDSLPITNNAGTTLVSSDRGDFKQGVPTREVAGAFVHVQQNAPTYVKSAQTIIEKAGLSPTDFKGELPDRG